MKAVVQRVKKAICRVDGKITGQCENGLFVLLGITDGDTENDAALLASKITGLRIFEDEYGKMNRSIQEVGGSFLVVSNFTLYAEYRKGNRPSFSQAAPPSLAEPLYRFFCDTLNASTHTECGIFGADMAIETLCDGPVTIVMESQVLAAPRNQK